MRPVAARAVWTTLYLLVMFSPALLSWAAPGELMDRLAVLTGLLGVVALLACGVLPSRLRSLTTTFGIEHVLASHRWLGIYTLIAVAAHLAVVLVLDPGNVAKLNLWSGPAAGRAGTSAFLLLAWLVIRALRRGWDYERWRLVHIALAGSVFVLTALHVVWLGNTINHPVMRGWFLALGVAVVAVVGYRWGFRRESRAYRIRGLWAEAPHVFTVCVEAARHRHPMTFSPGQFAWLRLRESPLAEDHPFTIASSACDPSVLVFTIRESGDFTRRLSHLRVGDHVWLDGPHGAFTSDARWQTGTVMIAGGVGITPMMAMLRTFADRGDQRPHRLIAVAATPDDLLFAQDLVELRTRLNLTAIALIRRPLDETQPLGEVDEALLTRLLPGPPRDRQLIYFCCGSPGLVDTSLRVLSARNIPSGQIHTEQFRGA